MSDNQLVTIVKESGLDKSKADVLLDNFKDYFEIAGEWEKKAKMLVVTDETQTAEMKMAREGRLFLKEKRITIENTRKQLKEQSLREGKAIDGIANVLKALIVPIEEYLDKQEHFVEIKEAEKAEALRIEAEKKAEKERIAEEKRIAEEQEKIRKENIRLQKEAKQREKQMIAEREKAEAEKKAIEDKARIEQEKADKERQEIEEKARKEKAEAERIARIEKEKADKKLAEERAEKERIQKLLDEQIECPYCHKKFNLEDK